jgi:hypothetical protein
MGRGQGGDAQERNTRRKQSVTIEWDSEAIDADSLAEAYESLKERHDELEAIVDRHARTMAAYGLDFTDTDAIVIADRERAVARLGEDVVKRLDGDA